MLVACLLYVHRCSARDGNHFPSRHYCQQIIQYVFKTIVPVTISNRPFNMHWRHMFQSQMTIDHPISIGNLSYIHNYWHHTVQYALAKYLPIIIGTRSHSTFTQLKALETHRRYNFNARYGTSNTLLINVLPRKVKITVKYFSESRNTHLEWYAWIINGINVSLGKNFSLICGQWQLIKNS